MEETIRNEKLISNPQIGLTLVESESESGNVLSMVQKR